MELHSPSWKSDQHFQLDIPGGSKPPDTINCQNSYDYEKYSRCIYREDISTKMNIAYSTLFGVFVVLLILIGWSIIKLIKLPKNQSRISIYRTVNALLLLSVLARGVYFFDSVLLLTTDIMLPLKYYLTLDSLAILALDAAMVIGAYNWVLTLLTLNFHNELKSMAKGFNYLLVLANIGAFAWLTFIFFWNDYRDEDFVRVEDSNLPFLLLTVPIMIDGFYFCLTCIMMWRYLQSGQPGNKSALLDRLVLLVGIVSFLRIGQYPLESSISFLWELRKSSIQNDDWIWPVLCVGYMLLTECFPILLLLLKFQMKPKPESLTQIHVKNEVNTWILNEEAVEKEAKDLSLLANANRSTKENSYEGGLVKSLLFAEERSLGQERKMTQ